jgi:hypothetical protein
MSELFNIIKKSLKNNNFYIPSQKSYVKGSCLSVKQFNQLLELETGLSVSFEQYIKYNVLSDKILRDNLESIDSLSYFDKPFLLIQLKIAQEKKYLSLSLEDYQKGITERTESLDLLSFSKQFVHENLEIQLGINKFADVEKISAEYLASLNNKFENETDIVTMEILKYILSIKYHGEEIYNSSVKDIKPLINDFPASLITTFNSVQKNLLEELNRINTFTIADEKYVFNPTIEFMLL